MSTSSGLVYTPLDTRKPHFRLLHLRPGREPEELTCDLRNELLTEGTTFEALSYVWGDPNIREVIKVNDTLVSVTKNLHDALRRLRDETVARVLWVDALCVNQQDGIEKSRQVNLMAKIYATATAVIA